MTIGIGISGFDKLPFKVIASDEKVTISPVLSHISSGETTNKLIQKITPGIFEYNQVIEANGFDSMQPYSFLRAGNCGGNFLLPNDIKDLLDKNLLEELPEISPILFWNELYCRLKGGIPLGDEIRVMLSKSFSEYAWHMHMCESYERTMIDTFSQIYLKMNPSEVFKDFIRPIINEPGSMFQYLLKFANKTVGRFGISTNTILGFNSSKIPGLYLINDIGDINQCDYSGIGIGYTNDVSNYLDSNYNCLRTSFVNAVNSSIVAVDMGNKIHPEYCEGFSLSVIFGKESYVLERASVLGLSNSKEYLGYVSDTLFS